MAIVTVIRTHRTFGGGILVASGIALLVLATGCGHERELPLFDAHIHYNHDTWEKVPPAEAVALLRKAGAVRALVSSSSDDGTQMLVAEAPDLIVPELRPYRTIEDAKTWTTDESIIPHVEARLARYRYVAIGEFHIKGEQADLPVVRRMVQLAKERGLMLHVHGDADSIERIFAQDPAARLLWAHGGFEPIERVRSLLDRHPHLWAEVSSRSDLTVEGHLTPAWRDLFLEYPDRFMVGTDTGAPSRWVGIEKLVTPTRGWLAELPADVAERIAYKNGESLLTAPFAASRARTP